MAVGLVWIGAGILRTVSATRRNRPFAVAGPLLVAMLGVVVVPPRRNL